MSTENPFSDFNQPTAPGIDNAKPLLTVFAVLGTLLLLFCGGLGTLLFYVQRQASPAPIVELPKRSNGFQACLTDFNEGLAELKDSSGSNEWTSATAIQVEAFVRSSLQAPGNDEPIPFNNDMFIEAVDSSEFMPGTLSIFQRMQLIEWLEISEPLPWSGGDCKVVKIREPQQNYAIVDFLLYTGDSQSESFRWHLVKSSAGWELFDWRALDFGQSMSDEYAGYIIGSGAAADGYDLVLEEINKADDVEDPTEAKRILRKAESTPLLESDRAGALMALAYAWRRQGKTDETLRITLLIPDPDEVLGAWPLLAECYRVNGEYEKAHNAADHMAIQSPHHPNAHLVRSEIWTDMNEYEKSVDAATLALFILPEDTATWNEIARLADAEHIASKLPQWIPLLAEGKQNDIWLQLLLKARHAESLPSAIQLLDSHERVPAGVAALAKGYLADRESKPDEAANWFKQSADDCEMESLAQHARTQHINVRLESEQYDKLMQDFEGNRNTTSKALESIARTAYNWDLSGDQETLLAALESAAFDDPWSTCTQAFLSARLYKQEQALKLFESLDEWLKEQLTSDEPWLGESIRRDFADVLLRQQGPLAVIGRWPNSETIHEMVGDYLVGTNDWELSQPFVDAAADSDIASIQLQRQRLLTLKAIENSDIASANNHHLKAIHFASELEEDISDRIVSDFARQLVFKTPEPNLPKYESIDSAIQFTRSAAYYASEQCDEAAFDNWFRLANKQPQNHSSAFRIALDFHRKQGNFSKAASLCDSYLLHADSANEEEQYAISRAASFYLEAGRYRDALNWFDAESSEVSREADVALAKGDGQELIAQLQAYDDDTASRWLSWRDDKLRRYAEEPWIASIQQKYPQPMQPGYARQVAEVLFPADHGLEQADLSSILTGVVGTKFDVAEIACFDQQNTAWQLTSKTTKQRIVITKKIVKLQASDVRADLRPYLAKPVLRVSLEWIDEGAKTREQVCKCAAEFAQRGAFAFCLDDFGGSSVIWSEPDLANQLRWQSRVPYSRRISSGDFVESDTSTDRKYQSYARWSHQLRAAKEGLLVEAVISTSFCTEVIPGKIVRQASPDERLIIRLSRSSQLDPLLVAGREYVCNQYNLLIPRKRK